MKLSSITLAASLLLVATVSHAQQITGAGATFPAPLYAKWAEAAKSAIGVELNYQSVGSGAGQGQIINRTVDFGASDAPVSADKLAAHNLVQVPSVMGAVVVIVNLPGVANNQLRLTGEVLAEIYAGNIRVWNDAKIQQHNPDLKLPSMLIAPFYRADGSGTTFVWTSYLSRVSPWWAQNVGANTSVKWPVGNGSRGNDGVAASVKQIRGSIGYVESVFAMSNNLVTTQLQNADQNFVLPNSSSFRSAASNADWANAKNFQVDIINQLGKDSWPIVSATYLLIPTDAKDGARTQAVIKWLAWAYANGDDIAAKLDYISLPTPVQKQVLVELGKIKGTQAR